MPIYRRKCFISYHHADQALVDEFVRIFDQQRDTFIARGLGREMSQDVIDSNDTDYVMRRIRELYLGDSTVTLVMCGRCTWARRYVDWELQSSLRSGQTVTPNGLLGVKLPNFDANHWTLPERLNANLLHADQVDCYARWVGLPVTADVLWERIEAAYQRRFTHQQMIVNPRGRFGNNRPC